MISNILALIGGVFEVTGVLLMANQYINVRWYQIPIVLISALGRGENAFKAVKISEISDENRRLSLQGLASIGLGFIIQFASSLVPVVQTYLNGLE